MTSVAMTNHPGRLHRNQEKRRGGMEGQKLRCLGKKISFNFVVAKAGALYAWMVFAMKGRKRKWFAGHSL